MPSSAARGRTPAANTSSCNEAYGSKVALFFAWARCSVIQPGAIAAVAFVMGDYAQVVLPLGPYGPGIYAIASIVDLHRHQLHGHHAGHVGAKDL